MRSTIIYKKLWHMKNYLCLLFVISALLLSLPYVNAEYVSDEKETLRGIKSMGVVIEDMSVEAEGDGLTKEKIRMDIEQKLRMSNIKVLDEKETAESPYLYIEICIDKRSLSTFIYEVSVSFKQLVCLKVKPDVSCYATTWKRCYLGGVSQTRMERKVRENIQYLVDKFTDDYRAVNLD